MLWGSWSKSKNDAFTPASVTDTMFIPDFPRMGYPTAPAVHYGTPAERSLAWKWRCPDR